MDYVYKTEEYEAFIETEKTRIKNGIIDQYIAIRKAKGLSQEKIANLTGIARTNIVRIEAKRNMPSIDILTKLANAVDMELEVRFVEKKEEKNKE